MNNPEAMKWLEGLSHLYANLTGAANAHIIVIVCPEDIPQGKIELLLNNICLLLFDKYLKYFRSVYDKCLCGLDSFVNTQLEIICVLYFDDHSADGTEFRLNSGLVNHSQEDSAILAVG